MKGFLVTTALLATSAVFAADSDLKKPWPHSVPCRIHDGGNRNLMVATLGNVETTLAQGTYDPVADKVTLDDGTVMENYYRDTLGIKSYAPLDKSHHPLPPSGWCTWYYYYNRITENEVKRNAQWIADNLKDFGAQYVQIDDGWQGGGEPGTGKRDWATVHPGNFPSGMGSLASYIKSLGLTPGIWIAPHGQSNPEFVEKHKDVFLFKPDGASASVTWEGDYLVDPSSHGMEPYMRVLFQTLCDWGYEYFKIDGQPIVVNEYAKKKEFMHSPDDDNVKLYRNTLDVIRDTIGKDRYLLGCWGMPVEGIGIMDGSRTKGDIVLGWEGGFMLALRAVQEDYYLHNIAWYSDPDVFILRSPLPYKQAQAWATIQGLSGLALMGTDRLEDLSESRVELLRRIYPAVDIRPLDLFKVKHDKTIFDLKVSHLDGTRNYDVVGLFNYNQDTLSPIVLKWADLGIDSDCSIHAFDFWNKDYLGAWENAMLVDVDPASCRVLTLIPDNGEIQLISTSRHITQGWIDLKDDVAFDSEKLVYHGTSTVVKNDPYALHFAFPKGKNYTVASAEALVGSKALPVKITNHQGWATASFTAKVNTDVEWRIAFAKDEFYSFQTGNPSNLAFHRTGSDCGTVKWQEMYWLNNGYQVYLDGKLMGYTPRAFFLLENLDLEKNHVIEVECTWEDGTVSPKRTRLEISAPPGEETGNGGE